MRKPCDPCHVRSVDGTHGTTDEDTTLSLRAQGTFPEEIFELKGGWELDRWTWRVHGVLRSGVFLR